MASGAAGDPAGRAVGFGATQAGVRLSLPGRWSLVNVRSTSFSRALCPPRGHYSARTHGDELHRSRGWHSWALSRGGARLRRGAYPAWCLGCSIRDSREETSAGVFDFEFACRDGVRCELVRVSRIVRTKRREKFELSGFKSARHTRVRQRARLSNARLSICRLHVVSNANGGMPSVTLWFERRSRDDASRARDQGGARRLRCRAAGLAHAMSCVGLAIHPTIRRRAVASVRSLP